MHNFSAFCSLSVALCLVVCVSANPEVTAERAAKTAVEQANASVTEVHARAQNELNKANDLLRRVELSKNQAAQASFQAAKAPQDNTEAKEIAEKIKRLSGAVDTSYSDAKGKLSTAVSTLTPLVEEAQGLVNAPAIEIKAKDGAPDDFTKTNGEAAALKRQADNLNQSITAALTPVSEVSAKADEMESNVKEALLAHSQVSAIVAVAKIKSMLASADNIILQIEEKKNEVSGIVQEIKKHCTTELIKANEIIQAECASADEALTNATGAVDNATKAIAEMTQQQQKAGDALKKVKAATDPTEAQKDVDITTACVAKVKEIVPQLNTALEKVKVSLTNANMLKHNMEKALSTNTSMPSTEQSKKTEKTNIPVREGTELNQKDETIQPTISVPLLVALIASAILQ